MERTYTRGGVASVNLVTQITKTPATILKIPATRRTTDAA